MTSSKRTQKLHIPELELPPNDEIPESAIAASLREELAKFIDASINSASQTETDIDEKNSNPDNDHDNDHNNHNDHDNNNNICIDCYCDYCTTKKMDIISERICDKIIKAFERLYDKYICDKNASYMINISSRNRKNLKHLFDANYYKSQLDKQQSKSKLNMNMNNNNGGTGNSRNSRNSSRMRFSIKFSIVGYRNNISSQRGKGNMKTRMKAELKKFLKENINDDGKTEADLIKWLLEQILFPFDESFKEIVFLMNDSYTRFKTQNRQLFVELCQQV